jgi:hypothetical protein
MTPSDLEIEISLILLQTIVLAIPLFLGAVRYVTKNVETDDLRRYYSIVSLLTMAYGLIILTVYHFTTVLSAAVASPEIEAALAHINTFVMSIGIALVFIFTGSLEKEIDQAVTFLAVLFGAIVILFIYWRPSL